jgi:hypothetical protein
MHSFASEHNAVKWRVVVIGRPERWPAFIRVFPLVVFPADANGSPDAAVEQDAFAAGGPG